MQATLPPASNIRPNELLDAVRRDLCTKMSANPSSPKHLWTGVVTETLKREGKRLGYEVYCKGAKGCHEWLLDVMWWRRSPRQSSGIALVAACVWGSSDLIWSLEKLLTVKAPYKIFAFEVDDVPEQERPSIYEQIKRVMMAYPRHVKGETYLFVNFDETCSKAHRFVVATNGAQTSCVFEGLPTLEPVKPNAAAYHYV